MVKSIDIAGKNIKTLFRDKKNLIFTMLIPIFIYGLMGFISGGTDSTSNSYEYNIGWIDHENGQIIDELHNIINNIDGFKILNYSTSESANLALNNKNIDAYIVFPEGFETYLEGESISNENISIYFRESTSEITKNIISSTLISIIDSIVNFNPNNIPIHYNENTISGENINSITLSTPGFLMYGLLNAITGGIILITSEYKNGQLKRLESSKLKPKDMITGHLISNTLIIFMQFIIGIIVLSLFGFKPYYYDIISLIIGVILAILILSIFQNSLIMIMGSILKTPDAAAGGIWLVIVPLMAFSGALFPLELVAPAILPYVNWIPTRIVVIIFQDIMVNAIPLWNISILLNLLWISLESLILFGLGIKLYRNFVSE